LLHLAEVAVIFVGIVDPHGLAIGDDPAGNTFI
jgi:hypothetical protein